MQQWPHNCHRVDTNTIIYHNYGNSMQSLMQFREYLTNSLENALELNKQLILKSMWSQFIQNGNSFSQLKSIPEATSSKFEQSQILYQKSNQGRKLNRKIIKKTENLDTKNIPKNFGTAIHVFMIKNPKIIKKLLAQKNVNLCQFHSFAKKAKQKINSLLQLRELWQRKEEDSMKNVKDCYRMISFEFLRRHSLRYIYSSRIKNTYSHVRYRKKLLQGIQRHECLYNLKDY